MTDSINGQIVLIYLKGQPSKRHLLAFPDADEKIDFNTYLLNINTTDIDGDWIVLGSEKEWEVALKRAQATEAVIYDVPVSSKYS
jgi:hypothetical protein